MKYVINENKLEQMVFKFLDSKFEDLEQVEGKRYDIVFKFPSEEYGIMGVDKIGNLFVNYDFINEIYKYFPIKMTDIQVFIGRYVEDRFNFNIIDSYATYSMIRIKKLKTHN